MASKRYRCGHIYNDKLVTSVLINEFGLTFLICLQYTHFQYKFETFGWITFSYQIISSKPTLLNIPVPPMLAHSSNSDSAWKATFIGFSFLLAMGQEPKKRIPPHCLQGRDPNGREEHRDDDKLSFLPEVQNYHQFIY